MPAIINLFMKETLYYGAQLQHSGKLRPCAIYAFHYRWKSLIWQHCSHISSSILHRKTFQRLPLSVNASSQNVILIYEKLP